MERPINGEDAKKETDPSVKSDPEPEHPNVDPQDENVGEKEIISSDTNYYNNDIHVDATSTNSKSSEISESASASDGDRSASPLSLKSKKSVRWSEELVSETPRQRALAQAEERGGSNPYTTFTPADSDNAPSINFKEKVESVKDVLGRWGRSVKEATKKAEELAGNTWQHLKTGPSVTDAALGRLAQGTKVLAEGGYEKIFRQTFETVPEEKLQNSYACYLSTSAGPVMGILYVSSAKLAFCSDSPLSYKSDDKTEWSYYKVVIPLHQLKGVNPSASRNNPSEKYIQVISVDSHEFWFMGFLTYDGAVQCLQEALVPHQAG